MSANERIQWLHKKISDRSYPGVAHLIERFEISRRQAQRDVNYLKMELGAPLVYSSVHKGYYYTEEFSLPFMMQSDSDADFGDVFSNLSTFRDANATNAMFQLQLPYSATLEITDRMTVLNLRSIIVKDEPHHRYRCEFPSVELFIGIIMSSGADIRVIEPEWLRERLVEFAKRVLINNEQ